MSWDAGAITGSLHLQVNEYAEGMLQAESIANFFPQIVTDFLEEPLIAFMDVIKEAGEWVKETFEQMGESFHQAGLAAANLGVSVEFISGLAAVARDAGVSTDQLGFAFKNLQQRAADALSGVSQGAKGFADLGINAQELTGLMKDPEQLFYRVAQGIASIENPAQKAQAASDLLGRTGYQMISVFEAGPDKLKAMIKELEELGGTVTTAEAQLGEKFGEMDNKFQAAWTGIKKAVAEPILQLLADNADAISEALKAVSGWLREGIAGGLAVVKPLAAGVWEVFKGLAEVLGPVLIPLFEVLLPILRLVAEALGGILKVVGMALQGFGQMLGFASSSLGIDQLGRSALEMSHTDYDAGGQPVPAAVHIDKVEVGPVDAHRVSGQIADKLEPQLRAAAIKQYTDLGKLSSGGHKISRAVGGRGPSHYSPGAY